MDKLEKVELVREKTGASYAEASEALEACEYDVLDAIIKIERDNKPIEPTVRFAESEPAPVREETLDLEVEKVVMDEVIEPEIVDSKAEAEADLEEAARAVADAAAAEAARMRAEAEASAAARESAEAEARARAEAKAAEREERRAKAAEHREERRAKRHAAWATFCSRFRGVLRSGLEMSFTAERDGEVMFTVPVLFVVIAILAWGAAIWLLIIGLFFGFRYRVEGVGPFTDDVNNAMGKAADVADDIKNDLS